MFVCLFNQSFNYICILGLYKKISDEIIYLVMTSNMKYNASYEIYIYRPYIIIYRPYTLNIIYMLLIYYVYVIIVIIPNYMDYTIGIHVCCG